MARDLTWDSVLRYLILPVTVGLLLGLFAVVVNLVGVVAYGYIWIGWIIFVLLAFRTPQIALTFM